MFIHGIGAPRDVAGELRSWTRALARGARRAGHSRFAGALEGGAVDAVFVHYADLFTVAQAQGDELDLTNETAQLLVQFMIDSVGAHLSEVSDDEQRDVLEQARAELEPADQEQGLLSPVRRSINAATTLLALPGLRAAGQWMGGKLLVRDLAQVARYLARAEADASGHSLDARIRQRLLAALDPAPNVVIAHSLGSVVAWEALHEYSVGLPLLVTLGSPLAMRTIVWPRLVPRPPATPPEVARWLNLWDRDDIITARPRLEAAFAPNTLGVRPDSDRIDSDGLWVHTATKYLCQPRLAGPVAEVAERGTSR